MWINTYSEKWYRMKIKARLTTRDIKDAIRQLGGFETELMAKVKYFESELADVGIEVIQDNIKVEYDGEVRNFGDRVTFQKQLTEDGRNITLILIAIGQPYEKQWIGGSALVNPLLMAEFGSGVFAVDGHKGTFPSDTAKKHTDNPPWFWKDTDGRTHMSSGGRPSRPMLKAKNEMENQIHTVAERVFSQA